MRYCEKCNREIESNVMDCPYCGHHSEIEFNEQKTKLAKYKQYA